MRGATTFLLKRSVLLVFPSFFFGNALDKNSLIIDMLLICVKAIKEPDWVYVSVYVIGYRKRQIFNRTCETAFLEAAQFLSKITQ